MMRHHSSSSRRRQRLKRRQPPSPLLQVLLLFLVMMWWMAPASGSMAAASRASIRSKHHHVPFFQKTKKSPLFHENHRSSTIHSTKHKNKHNVPFQLTQQLRGGASKLSETESKKNATKTSSKKSKTSSSTKSKKKRVLQETTYSTKESPASIFDLLPVSSAADTAAPKIQVIQLLQKRIISWHVGLRLVLGICVAYYTRQCLQTMGIPRRTAIWSFLQQHPAAAGLLATTSTQMPPDFHPTPFHSFLANLLAKAAQDDLPPSHLPSGQALMWWLASGLAYLSLTWLLPHWFLPVQLYYDYQRCLDAKAPSAVLVQVSHDINGKHHQKRHQTICQLHSTSLRHQMEHKLPPYYFEHEHRRYYYAPETNQCWEGGPNLQLSVATLVEQSQSHSSQRANNSTSTHKKYKGLLKKPSKLMQAQDRWYAYNHQTSVPIPTLRQALRDRLTSPLVVVQMLGNLLAVLEDGGKIALISLMFTVGQHWHNARRSIGASRTLQQDVAGVAQEFSTTPVMIYRMGQWQSMVASDLLPGDLFVLSTSSSSSSSSSIIESKTDNNSNDNNQQQKRHNKIVPVDALVLDGLCVTMEAVLTGESVPQTKMPLDCDAPAYTEPLDMNGRHRSAVLFAGTTLLHCAGDTTAASSSSSSKLNDKKSKSKKNNNTSSKKKRKEHPPGVLCLALRTGSYSSKGELINALTSSQGSLATISNAQFDRDALKLIVTMSFVAVLACARVLCATPSSTATTKLMKETSGFRQILQCTRILTSCIPSELPMALSGVVQNCAQALRAEADVVSSQPGSLLTASQVDTVVFDKTGTLTADTQSLSKIVTYPEEKKAKVKKSGKSAGADSTKQSASMADLANNVTSTSSELVLAGCHSLVQLASETTGNTNLTRDKDSLNYMVGDPLELAAFRSTGWKYDPDCDCYYASKRPSSSFDRGEPVIETMWQVKVFPFDPAARLSSAICLTRDNKGKFKIWAVVKGAPEAMEGLITSPLESEAEFQQWYKRKVTSLESRGYRSLAMGVRDMTDLLSQNGLQYSHNTSSSEASYVSKIKEITSTFHRHDLEEKKLGAKLYDFAGLACFRASVRPSSKRVLRQLAMGNIHTVMLTGDGTAAAIAVAAKVGMFSNSGGTVAALEVLSSHDSSITPKLQWRLISNEREKSNDAIVNFDTKSVRDIIAKTKRGELDMVASGDAIITVIQGASNGLNGIQDLADELNMFSVVARASPRCKESYVAALTTSGRRVLMCGDGVNDVSAMKEAEVSVALLYGFGTESSSSRGGKTIDTEDERRRQYIQRKYRKVLKKDKAKELIPSSSVKNDEVGSSTKAAMRRVQRSIVRAQQEITQRVMERHGLDPENMPETIPYSFRDIRDMFGAIYTAIKEERGRNAKLRKGGAEAATILAEEDMLMKQTPDSNRTSLGGVEIRPGEACMASPFSCLRSSIDGVEAVLRAGLATAGCALSIQQRIMMQSLMTCFYLSTFYRRGVRFSNNMYTIQQGFLLMLDVESFKSSSSMRPHLSRSCDAKNSKLQSLFESNNLLSVVSQAIIHLAVRETGIAFAQAVDNQQKLEEAVKAQLKPLIRPAGYHSPKSAALIDMLIGSKVNQSSKKEKATDFLGRPKFFPSIDANIIFLLNVLQFACTTLVFHKGSPYYPSLLESTQMCVGLCYTILFVAICTLETFPWLNRMIGFKPWTSKRQKLFVLGLALINCFGCAAVEWFCRQRQRKLMSATTTQLTATTLSSSEAKAKPTAADEEERLLQLVSRKNFQTIVMVCQVTFFITMATVFQKKS